MTSRRPPRIDRARRAQRAIERELEKDPTIRERTARMLRGELPMGEEDSRLVTTIRLRPELAREIDEILPVMRKDPRIATRAKFVRADAIRHLLALGLEVYRREMARRVK